MGYTPIEWTDFSWNPIRARLRDAAHAALTKGGYGSGVGHYCEKISPGCAFCYSGASQPRFGMPEFPGARKLTPLPVLNDRGAVPVSDKVEVFLDAETLREPLSWRKPRKVFVCDMTDLFGAWVPDGWIMRVLDVMARTPHTYQVLTKRPDRMADFFRRWGDLSGEDFDPKLVRGPEATRKAHPSPRGQLFASMLETMGQPPEGCAFPTFDWMEGMIRWPSVFDEIWLGTSVENQAMADQRVPELLKCPAAVRFLSCEPLLGPIDLKLHSSLFGNRGGPISINGAIGLLPGIDWCIVGGESGPKARPMHPEWARSIRDQCTQAGVAFFFKQWGEWAPFAKPRPGGRDPDAVARCAGGDMVRVGKKAAGRLLDGREWSEFPKATVPA